MAKYIPEIGDVVRLTEKWALTFGTGELRSKAKQAIGLIIHADRENHIFHIKWFNHWGIEHGAYVENIEKIEV